uniref:Signal peptide protein n=1 Tax=Globodera pallida TaxID=36090 RepID=A0A183BKS2_GLOPA
MCNSSTGLPFVQISQPPAQSAEIEKPKPPVKVPADYDMQRVAANAAAKVYGWLPADKQPKKIKDQEAPKSVPTPPADYDVERVAAKAAHAVYGWLPKEQQPQLMDDDERASHVPSALN